MNANAKAALALVVPAFGMFIGVMLLKGPQAQLGRAQKPKRARYWRRRAERERKTIEKMKSRAGTSGRSLYQVAFGAGDLTLAEKVASLRIGRRLWNPVQRKWAIVTAIGAGKDYGWIKIAGGPSWLPISRFEVLPVAKVTKVRKG